MLSTFLRTSFLLLVVGALTLGACGVVSTSTKENTPPTEPPLLTSTPSPTSESKYSSDRAAQIVDRGVIRVGVRNKSLPPFIMIGASPSGFEIDIIQAITDWLFDDHVTIQWFGTSAADTFSSLQENRFDLLIRTLVHSEARNDFALWSDPYWLSGLGTLVRTRDGIAGFAELDGKRVSTIEGLEIDTEVAKAAAAEGVEIIIVTDESHNKALGILRDGNADAYVNDWTLLMDVVQIEPYFEIIGDLIRSRPLAIALPLEENGFQDDINRGLRAIVDDGTFEEIYARWFSDSHPWTLEEMLNTPPAE
jgi:ABC-type amino acid transport substrate-binding protein